VILQALALLTILIRTHHYIDNDAADWSSVCLSVEFIEAYIFCLSTLIIMIGLKFSKRFAF
ncbi:hypothetical protein, partial [Providencia stuartii]|uniref:hypothetical protein n=1 Tax=Providencia stuartii TaxID=588 RepID=UPI002AA0AD74